MTDPMAELATRCEKRFQGLISGCKQHVGEVTLEVPAAHLLEVCRALRDEPELGFEQLTDLCGVDYLSYGEADWETSESATTAGYSRGREPGAGRRGVWQGPRFTVVYHLLSLNHNRRIRLRVYAEGEPPRLPSVIEVWNSANWYEREAFDLFGILFEGHPDLRRILSDYGFVGHPFRKDFPLTGEVEMRYDLQKQRVIYQPVSIENRITVARVIPRDYRYADEVQKPETGDDA